MRLDGLFVDRDGTINIEKGYVYRASDLEYIPGALAGLKLASERDVSIYIVTNQAGIAKGKYSEHDFEVLTDLMLGDMRKQGIRIADVLYCPHHPDATVPEYRQVCPCRKPGTEMLTRAMRRDGLRSENLALVGDKNSDIEAGQRLGIRTYLVETGYGSQERATTRADFVVPDLEAAVNHVLFEKD